MKGTVPFRFFPDINTDSIDQQPRDNNVTFIRHIIVFDEILVQTGAMNPLTNHNHRVLALLKRTGLLRHLCSEKTDLRIFTVFKTIEFDLY